MTDANAVNSLQTMALSEFYESTIIEAKASFGYSSFECNPDEISDILGITPDGTMRKGEKWIRRSGETAVRPVNSWWILSKAISKDVNVHLRELLERLGKSYELAKRDWGKASFGITWKNNYLYAGTGPFFEADVLQGIAKWNAELYQDIYQIDQEPDGPLNVKGEKEGRRITREELRRLFNPE